jgi:hypothetical protein
MTSFKTLCTPRFTGLLPELSSTVSDQPSMRFPYLRERKHVSKKIKVIDFCTTLMEKEFIDMMAIVNLFSR